MIFPFVPKNVQIEVSNQCSLSCPLCPTGRSEVVRDKLDIPVSYFKEVISNLEEFDPRIQLWNYGEPLLHPNIIELVSSVSPVFSDCAISTNGQFMSEELADAIAVSGITEIIFAIDGLNQSTYQEYRRGGSLEKALASIDMMAKAKERNKSDLQIEVQFIVFKHNFDEIPFLGEFFFPHGVNDIKVKSAMMMLEGTNEELVSASEKYLYMNYPGERYKVVDGKFLIKGKPMNKCPLLENSLVVTTDGTFLPCCWDYKGDFPIPNETRWESVKSIINSDSPPSMCLKCPIKFQHTFSWPWNQVPGVKYYGDLDRV